MGFEQPENWSSLLYYFSFKPYFHTLVVLTVILTYLACKCLLMLKLEPIQVEAASEHHAGVLKASPQTLPA